MSSSSSAVASPVSLEPPSSKFNSEQAQVVRGMFHRWRQVCVKKKSLEREFTQRLLTLPHRKFVEEWRYEFGPKLRNLSLSLQDKTQQKMMSVFENEREAFESRFARVICTDLGSNNALPQYTITTTLPENAERIADTAIYLTKEMREKYAAMPKSFVPTKKELDDHIQTLSGKTDLFAWDYLRRGCLPKATVAADMFALCCVPRKNMRFRFVRIPQECRVKPFDHWNFHVGLEVLAADKEWRVADCGLSPLRSMNYRDWMKLQKNPSENPSVVEIKDDLEKLAANSSFTFPYDGKKVITFTIPTHMRLVEISSKDITVGPQTEENRNLTLAKLPAYRFEIERRTMHSNS